VTDRAKPSSLFDLVVPKKRVNALYAKVRSSRRSIAARMMLDNVFAEFHDRDGNFVEQFQTSGFPMRLFELYLFAYFNRSGFQVDRSHPYPDFLVEREGHRVAVEATTLNPSSGGMLATKGKKIKGLNENDLLNYRRHELPIRFGSVLSSKLKKKYWTKPHCTGLPIVIAVEAFHDALSLLLINFLAFGTASQLREARFRPDPSQYHFPMPVVLQDS
jgi:hypothetical protein